MLCNKKIEDNKLIFICGCPRSGTSWTWGMLKDLERVEPLLIEDFPSIRSNSKIKKMAQGDYYATTETTIFHSNLSDSDIVNGIAEKQSKHQNRYLLEKTPSNALKLDRITNLFPNAKIIHIVRDPPCSN